LANRFGIHFNENSRNQVTGSEFHMGMLHVPPQHIIFKTAKTLYLKEISTLQVKTPAQSVLSEGGDVIMAVARVGKGAVFAVGDPWLYNEYVDGRKLPASLENFKAAHDLVKWVLTQSKIKTKS
jgi:unsaturated rhamnogalacturonyl hydrolase